LDAQFTQRRESYRRFASPRYHATNDIGLILLPDGRYLAIAVFITDSHEPDAAARDAVIAHIARAAYDAAY
jgi:hypothetical protein